MILKFLRFESEIALGADHVATLQVEDRQLFARMVSSLLSESGEEALEPYALWDDDGKQMSARSSLLVLDALPTVPLTDRKLLGKLHDRIARTIADDDVLAERVGSAIAVLEELLADRGNELWGTYDFAATWDSATLLKSFAFQPRAATDEPLAERLVNFFELCADIALRQTLVLVNAKSFFAENDLELIAEQSFFCGIPLLLLESWPDETQREWERKTRIDQWFLEN